MRTKKKSDSPHYVNNKQFYEAIVEYKSKVKEAEETGREKPRISNYIGECIYKISNNLANMPNFINYSYREEMIDDGIENCILYFDNYSTEYKNPFAYFTQICKWAFVRRIKKERKERYALYKNFQETIMNTGNAVLLTDGDDKHLLSSQTYDNILEFMEKFEQDEAKQKEKRKLSKNRLYKDEDKNEEQ